MEQPKPVPQLTIKELIIILALAAIISIFIFADAHWRTIKVWVEVVFWFLVGFAVLVTFLHFMNVIRLRLPFRRELRRFQRGHWIKRLLAYKLDPQKLSNADDNLDHMDRLDAKVERRSLHSMSQELNAAKKDYETAVKNCNGDKVAIKLLKDTYDTRVSRIKTKYTA